MATILMVTRPIVPPWNEGSKNTAWQIAQRAKRHHFHLLTSQSTNQLPVDNSITWQRIYTDENFVTPQKLHLLWYLLHSNGNIDIHHFLFVPTPVTSRLLSGIVHWRRNSSVQTVPSLYKSNLNKKTARSLFFADRVVTFSDWTANELESLGVKNVVRINAGIDVDRFKPVTNKKQLREKFGLPLDPPVILFSGELSRLGSVELVLSIIPRVLAQQPEIQFVFSCPIRSSEDVISMNKAQQTIHNLDLSSNVHFINQVNDFSELLNISDIFFFPVATMDAKIDTPLTILEAMAVGLPVIITQLEPLNEILKIDTAGVSIPPDDNVEGFVDAILKLAFDKNCCYEMGVAGQKVINADYNLEKMVQAYEQLYDTLS